MDETSLRELLERALVPEPPIGPVVDNSLRAGIKLRRRLRLRAAAGVAASESFADVVALVDGYAMRPW